VQLYPTTYYYGFNISREPFDDPLVRRAFAAAINRSGLVKDAREGSPQPALTFTPPGLFGHVDGYSEGVGIRYNPAQATQWIAAAGYPHGQGLPPVTLTFNSGYGHEPVAEYVQDSWFNTLGVSVTLEAVAWSEYYQRVGTGEVQMYRYGWGADYPDAYTFLDGGVLGEIAQYGLWSNASYEAILHEAAREHDPATREALYKEAERILVETDPAMIPLYYYYGSTVATRPYLERTYHPFGFDIASWRITRVSTDIDTGGGSLGSYHGGTTVEIPAGAVSDTVVLTYSPAYGLPPEGNLRSIGRVFDLAAAYRDTGQPAQIVPGGSYSLTLQLTDAEIGPTIEDTLGVYWWDESGGEWSQQGVSSTANVTDNIVAAQVTHFSRFAVLGETSRVYLPMVLLWD
jgi:hypothetical protein